MKAFALILLALVSLAFLALSGLMLWAAFTYGQAPYIIAALLPFGMFGLCAGIFTDIVFE